MLADASSSSLSSELDRLLEMLVVASAERVIDHEQLKLRAQQLTERIQDLRGLKPAAPNALTLGGLRIDFAGHEVFAGEERVPLTPREFVLLSFLLRQRGRVCTRREILAHAWSDRRLASGRTVDIHVYRLRAKLAPYGDMIQTVRHVGYIVRVAEAQAQGGHFRMAAVEAAGEPYEARG